MNKFENPLALIEIWNDKCPSTQDYELFQWAVNYLRENSEVITEALSLASRIEPFKEQLAELVAVGDKATQGEWMDEDSPFEVFNADHGALGKRHVCNGSVMLMHMYSDSNAPFVVKAANLRPFFKAILGEV